MPEPTDPASQAERMLEEAARREERLANINRRPAPFRPPEGMELLREHTRMLQELLRSVQRLHDRLDALEATLPPPA